MFTDKYRVPVKAWSGQGIVANSDTDSHSGNRLGFYVTNCLFTDKYRVPVKAWSGQGIVANSDTDSHSGSSKSLDSSPSNSPYPAGHKKMALTGSLEDLIEADPALALGVKQLLAVPGTDHLDVQSLVRVQSHLIQ